MRVSYKNEVFEKRFDMSFWSDLKDVFTNGTDYNAKMTGQYRQNHGVNPALAQLGKDINDKMTGQRHQSRLIEAGVDSLMYTAGVSDGRVSRDSYDFIPNPEEPETPDPVFYPVSSAPALVRPSSPQFSYIDAPWAERYQMSRETAYQEALANTSHQREVADLRAAGLNPVLSANGGSGSSVFSGSVYAPASSSSSAGSVGSARSQSSVSPGDWIELGSDIAGLLTTVATGSSAAGNMVSRIGKKLAENVS